MMDITSDITRLAAILPVVYFGNQRDVVLFVAVWIYRRWDQLQLHFTSLDFSVVIGSAIATLVLLVVLQAARLFLGLRAASSPGLSNSTIKPMLFPCETAHTRLFPAKHSFSYSYLLAGIPVGWHGSLGGMLSVDTQEPEISWYRKMLAKPACWFSVNNDDYFARGQAGTNESGGGLVTKLHGFLKTQSVDPSSYPYAYLLTAPRFMGYVSNPVSIWNLYSAKKELSAMILEVNNTFDERHSYFLKRDLKAQVESESQTKFTKTWPKQFYVSPFNSHDGTYSVTAEDPLAPYMEGDGRINTTITLSSTEGKAKLVARLYSTQPPVDPRDMTMYDKIRFLTRWWWVGFSTFAPRTVYQAFLLYVKRKLPPMPRPQPNGETLSRHADATEELIEGIFKGYLRSLVKECRLPFIVKYTPAGTQSSPTEIMKSPSASLIENDNEIVHLKVLTPSFYSQLIHYGSTPFGILSQCQKDATIWISDQESLSRILADAPSTQMRHIPALSARFMRILRQSLVSDLKYRSTSDQGPEPSGLSDFERFVLSHTSVDVRNNYLKRVLKLFLSEKIALGWPEILDLEVFVIKCAAFWYLVAIVFS